MNAKILLVEDDESLGFVTKDNLEENGYDVRWVKEGKEAEEVFAAGQFDICILDVMLPKQDGFTLARAIRGRNEFVPILFLTARSMEEDRLKGFEIGGDDYISKPFSVQELLYRVRVFVRRNQRHPESDGSQAMTIGRYQFDKSNLRLTLNGINQPLTKMESDLLELLLASKNELVRRSDILVKIWGEDDYFKGRSLDVFISRLRKYLQNDPTIEIRNHHSVGFTLRCDT